MSIGVDYFGQILVKNPDAGISEAILKSTIVNTPGVTALLSFKLTQNYSNRILNLQFSAATTHGTISYEGIL